MVGEKIRYRDVMEELLVWKEKIDRKSLLLYGLEGTGKTTIVKAFAMEQYAKFLYFDVTDLYGSFSFQKPLKREQFDDLMEQYTDIYESKEDIFLIFDHMDEKQLGENTLEEVIRFLSEELRDYNLCMISSLDVNRCISEQRREKLEVKRMYPVSLKEFMVWNDAADLTVMISNQREQPLEEEIKKKLRQYLAVYYITGGMPQVLQTYMDTKSIEAVSHCKNEVLMEILKKIDAIPDEKLRLKTKKLYLGIPEQMRECTEGFSYLALGLFASEKKYLEAVEWLEERMYLKKITDAPGAMKKKRETRFFFTELGLLSAQLGITFESLICDKSFPAGKEEVLTRQFILENLMRTGIAPEITYGGMQGALFVLDGAGQSICLYENYGSVGSAEPVATEGMKLVVTKDEMTFDDEKNEIFVPVYALWNL